MEIPTEVRMIPVSLHPRAAKYALIAGGISSCLPENARILPGPKEFFWWPIIDGKTNLYTTESVLFIDFDISFHDLDKEEYGPLGAIQITPDAEIGDVELADVVKHLTTIHLPRMKREGLLPPAMVKIGHHKVEWK